MISKINVISGFVSGVMLAAVSFATPASAGQTTFNLDIGIGNLLNELIAPEDSGPKVHKIDYRGVPIRKIHRKMRRRGLYPVSDYRLRGDRVIIRAEDDYGSLFRVVADADYGDLLKIRRVRQESRRRRAPVEQPSYYDDGYDNYRPGYNRPIRRNKQRYDNTHAERKARKDAARAHARRKAAKQSHAQRKAALIRGDVARRAKQARADNARRARQARADRNRRVGVQSAPRNKKPYIGQNAKRYKEQQYGGGK